MNSLHYLHSFCLLLLSYFFIAEVKSLEGSYFFYQQPEYPRDCKEVHEHCSSDNSSGIYTIKPDGYPNPFEVYCNNQLSRGGWTVIQRRIDGSVKFKRNWEDYKNGFGFLSSEFYIGNDKLAYLTNQAVYELRIDMMLSNGSHFYVNYKSFRVSDEWSQYALVNAEEFSGNSSCVASSCPTDMVHERCTCQTSCRDHIGMADCREVCVETCVPKRCFATETNSFILEGESYVVPGCSRRCSCTDRQLICNNYQCDLNAVCETRNNEFQCYCNAGYTGDGVTCRSICQTNEVYGTCTCQKSCGNPTGCVSCNQGEMCYCPNEFYLQGGNCVPKEDCGCFIDGNILQNGETYVNSDCSMRCTCNNDQLSCNSNYECSSNAICSVQSGVRQCYCNIGYEGDGETCTPLVYTDCNDVQNAGITQDGVYSIRPTGWSGSSFNVFCNMTIDGGGWIVFQRRINGATTFYRNWADYKNGFGDIQQEFWLGNEKLYYLTQQATYEYRVDFVYSSSSYHNKYSRFRIDDEANNYEVTDVGSRTGTRGASLYNTQNIAFSTHDRDNDGQSSTDCAEGHRSGWWHGGDYFSASGSHCRYFPEGSRHRICSNANLNGDYNGGNGQNIFDYDFGGLCNIKYTEMKIRRTT